MAQNMTKFTLTIVLLGFALALAVFPPQVLSEEIMKPTEQPEDSPSPPADQAPSAQDEDSLAAQRLQMARQWAELKEAQAILVQDMENLAVERAQVDQGWQDLKAEQESLIQDKEELQDERARVDEAQKKLEAERTRLADLQQELEAERARIAEERKNLEAERTTLAELQRELEAERGRLNEQERRLRTLQAVLSEQEQGLRALQRLTLTVLALGGLIAVSLILLVVVAMWKEKRVASSAVDPTKMPKSTRQKQQAYPKMSISPTCGRNGGGNNGKGKKEVIHTP